jgi:DNA invertase Pin-like site-specific DNA recombinase
MRRSSDSGAISRTRIRCAIYTRKSTEEGLDQDFNSLDAQREACASYINSQRHEGWTLLPHLYDDGGFSGGNMERPGLQRLLAEVKAGRVDVIVVYKVDRLTRSLTDFAKIVEVLDGAGASFVSVTQSFNTTTSMGRLTLNVLLSFAQFEREVIAERVRDKIAASKQKGMWMGGVVPLGYEVQDRKLIVVPEEAERVRHIMRRYLELRSVKTLMEDLNGSGIPTKLRVRPDGTTRGGGWWSREPSTACSRTGSTWARCPIATKATPPSMRRSSSVTCLIRSRRCSQATRSSARPARKPITPACSPA